MIQIRNVPDDVRRALKVRAAAAGEPLNTFLLRMLAREVEQPTVAEVLARAARRAERAGVSSVEVLAAERAMRDQEVSRQVQA